MTCTPTVPCVTTRTRVAPGDCNKATRPRPSDFWRRYTVLQYADDDVEAETGAGASSSSKRKTSSSGAAGDKGSESGAPAFYHLPLSDSTLLVWVYRFDCEDPYRAVPNPAALQFARPGKSSADEAPLDVEAAGRNSKAVAEAAGMQAGPRDAGILSWLWGPDEGDLVDEGGDSGSGRVRQHFVGSAAWQGRPGPAAERRGRGRDDEEEHDIQRAIALSLAAGGGEGKEAGEQDLVEMQGDES